VDEVYVRFALARAGWRSINRDEVDILAPRAEDSFIPQLFHNLVASLQAAEGGVGLMARSARNYELAIAALGGALAMVTFLFLWERSSIEAAAKSVDTTRVDRSGHARMFRWPYHLALGLLPPDEQYLNDEVGPTEPDSPYDVFSPYLHNVPASGPATSAAPPRQTRTASLRPNAPKPSTPPAQSPPPGPSAAAPDFWVPDVASLLIPAASVALLAVPLAELERAKYNQVVVWAPAPGTSPSADPPGFSGPFHLFFTTDSPTGVAPVAESGGSGGGSSSSTLSTVTDTVSSTTSTVTGLASSTTSSLTGLESSTTSAATDLVSSTTSTATGLVSSVLRRH
jgi:hypothetical protein